MVVLKGSLEPISNYANKKKQNFVSKLNSLNASMKIPFFADD